MIGPIAAVVQRDGDQAHPAALGTGDERAPRVAGVAGLEADAAGIRREQLIVVRHRARADARRARRDDARERRVLHGVGRKARHIEGTGAVSHFVETTRVHKRCVLHAEGFRLFVHPSDKLRAAAAPAAVGGDALRRVVAGRQHQTVEKFLHRERFALEKVHRRALAQVLAFDRDLLREFAVLQRD